MRVNSIACCSWLPVTSPPAAPEASTAGVTCPVGVTVGVGGVTGVEVACGVCAVGAGNMPVLLAVSVQLQFPLLVRLLVPALLPVALSLSPHKIAKHAQICPGSPALRPGDIA